MNFNLLFNEKNYNFFLEKNKDEKIIKEYLNNLKIENFENIYNGWLPKNSDQEKYIIKLFLSQLLQNNLTLHNNLLLECIDIDPSRLESYFFLMINNFSKNKKKAIGFALMAPILRENQTINYY